MSDSLRTAKVSFKDTNAGRLEETADGGTRFIYHEDWRQTIACCFPVARREHEWRDGLHPFFQHLGAEGWLRERQARAAHVSEEDDFGLLLRYGADCIGAVGVLPETALPPLGEAADALADNPGRTISGVQRKLLVVRDEGALAYRPAGATGPAPFIAKFNSEALPTLVANEHRSLRWIAAMLGEQEVASFALGHVTELDEIALIVTRFDRTPDGDKLRTEDFAQILCKPRGRDHAGKYNASYEDVAEVIQTHSARPDIDLARLFRRLLAFTLIANADAHLKNFSLLERPEGLRLSPVYDVVNVGVYPGYSQNLALAIGGEIVAIEAVSRALLEGFATRIGLAGRIVDQTFAELRTRARQAQKLVAAPEQEGPDGFSASFAEVVRNGCQRLLET